ncbi:MAG: hypothetical protein ACRDGQ_09295 [Candidatus Limnocylindrales bacterium]
MTDFGATAGRRLGRATTGFVLAIAALFALSGAAFAAQPAPALDGSVPARLPWMRELASPNSYVGQYTYVQCVAASIQMMTNMITGQASHSAATQHAIWVRARALSEYTGDGGIDPYGWSRYLGQAGVGSYQIYAGTSLADTIQFVARAMAQSGRPAGITVYAGGHAWVISGIRASTNPALSDTFVVQAVSISDPLWTLSRHGPGTFAPSTWFSLTQLKAYFTPYHDPRRAPSIEGRYVAIVPVPSAAELAHDNSARQVITFPAFTPTKTWSALIPAAPARAITPASTVSPAPAVSSVGSPSITPARFGSTLILTVGTRSQP